MEVGDIKGNKVLRWLYDAIRNGKLHCGQILTERGLSEELGVSRTPVREAFRRLEKEGLIEYEPHKGVKIISFSMERIKQLYQVREVLEGLGARILAKSPDKNLILSLQSLLEKAEIAVANGEIARLSEINVKFHMSIASATGNVYLENIMQTLQSHISLGISTSLAQSGRPSQNLQEHWLILNAIKKQDPELAEVAAKSHIRNALANILLRIKN